MNFHEQLENNINGSIKTWAIKWYTSIFLANGLCLYPHLSLTKNIGLDGSGVHCDPEYDSAAFDENNKVQVTNQFLEESEVAKRYLQRYYVYGEDSSWKRRINKQLLQYRYRFMKKITQS